MLILISPAKTFAKAKKYKAIKGETKPIFSENAKLISASALDMLPTLQKALGVNDKIFKEGVLSLRNIATGNKEALMPSLLAYSGMVYQKISAKDFDDADWDFASEHLRITSFVYGLLKPTDLISSYRMEGTCRLPMLDGENLFSYWTNLITDLLIDETKKNGGVLFFAASAEMKSLFDWNRVKSEVRVIEPSFDLILPDMSLKQIVIYTKMCRGLIVREIIKNKILDPEQIKSIKVNGFVFSDNDSTDDNWKYYRQEF